jgi:uncharacterized ParB-like nuclease family protein
LITKTLECDRLREKEVSVSAFSMYGWLIGRKMGNWFFTWKGPSRVKANKEPGKEKRNAARIALADLNIVSATLSCNRTKIKL